VYLRTSATALVPSTSIQSRSRSKITRQLVLSDHGKAFLKSGLRAHADDDPGESDAILYLSDRGSPVWLTLHNLTSNGSVAPLPEAISFPSGENATDRTGLP
jgi:hypothetical protein